MIKEPTYDTDAIESLNQEDEHYTRLTSVVENLRNEVGAEKENNSLLKEALAELELALEDSGWSRMAGLGDREFSPSGLRKLRKLARLNFLKNPLIRHGVSVQSHYVWGQGVTVSADDEGVNQVLQKFLEDPKNIGVFSGHQARLLLEQEFQVESDIFFSMWTNQNSGRVVIRRFIADEVQKIITNPEDYMEPWFYKRVWSRQSFNADSDIEATEQVITYHPDWRLVYVDFPSTEIPHPTTIGGYPVMWDAPVYHLKTGGFSDQKFGCPEIYSSLDWARAVKDDLEDYATIRRSLARFAWKQKTTGGRTGVQAAKVKLGTTLNAGGTGRMEGNPPPATGSVYIGAEGQDLTPMKTAGMTPSPEEGRRLWLMVCAGLGIPETILSGNADVGNLATAKTLDRPTELQMENRRQVWTDVYIDILNYVVDMAMKCPNGLLYDRGEQVIDSYTDLVTYEFTDDGTREMDIRFPSILRHDILPLVQAIVQAVTLDGKASAGIIDDRTAASMLLSSLGENEYDDIIAFMFPEQEVTFNAGKGILPPGSPIIVGPPQPEMPKLDGTDGIGAGTGAPSNGTTGDFDPGVSFDLMNNSTRKTFSSEKKTFSPEMLRSIRESVGQFKTRRGSNRSGIAIKSNVRKAKSEAPAINRRIKG